MHKPWVFFVIIADLLTLSCSRSERAAEGRSYDPLAETIWTQLLAGETESQYSERLDADTLQLHQKNLAFLRGKIPKGYPEPYFPYGRLKNRDLDPLLVRSPVLNESIVILGKKLFFDQRLSFSEPRGFSSGVSCAQCHHEEKAFTDGRALSVGATGALTHRNAPTLFNAAYNATLTWANPVFPILEFQAQIPLFGNDPVEMGLRGKEQDVLELILSQDLAYQTLFQDVYGLAYPADLKNGRIDYSLITSALAAYERTLINFDTKFDRFLQGSLKEGESFTADERAGAEIFYGLKKLQSGDTLPCAQCHAGVLMTNSFQYVREGTYFNRKSFHNTGLYNRDGKGAYPPHNTGFANSTSLAAHPSFMGQFRVPPLRFVGLTAPYGHDGSFPTLESVIRAYAAGGRASLTEQGQNPFVDVLVRPGFRIADEEVMSLVAFLSTLQ